MSISLMLMAARLREQAALDAEVLRLAEATFMASLDWTVEQVAAYQARVQGVSDRMAARFA